MTNKPLILITNDDGYKAKGINSLAAFLRDVGEIIMVAPDSACSGMSSAITVKVPLRVNKVWDEPGFSIYRCSGTPVDSVKIALNQITSRKPDLIVSGINHGTNTSVSVHYSGTMGAAIEGCINNIPSIGFSLNSYKEDADFSFCEQAVRRIVQEVLENGLPTKTCLNVNFPDGSNLKGVKVCRQASGEWVEEFEKRTDPHGGTYYWLTGYFKDHEPEAADTDEWAVKNGYISVVPCKTDITNIHSLTELKTRFEQ